MVKILSIVTAALVLLLALSTMSVSAAAPVLGPGMYDSSAPVFDFTGNWLTSSDTKFYGGSNRYTSESTATISFSIYGDGFRLLHVTAFNRGDVIVTIDGIAHTINMYSSGLVFQSYTEFAGLGAGEHTVTMQKASGDLFGIDAVLVLPHVESPETTPEPVTVVVTVEPVMQPAPEWIDTYSAEDGHAVAFDYSVSAGDVMSSVLMFGLLVLGLFGFSRQQLRKL
jgi:hypothetical protein